VEWSGVEARPQASADSLSSLQPQEVVLGWCGEYLKPGDLMWSGGLVQLLDELGFTAGASRIALNRIVSRGLLERVRNGRRIYYRMTDRILRLLDDGHNQTYFYKNLPPWDGSWTIVWYSIPDSMLAQRRRLARRLGFLSFAALQDGTWIIPRDMAAELKTLTIDLGLENHVLVIVGSSSSGMHLSEPLRSVWDIDQLSRRYDEFIDQFSSSVGRDKSLQPSDSFALRTAVIDSFRQLANLDPRLPAAVIGGEWRQPQAIEVFERLTQELYLPAVTHFSEVTEVTLRRRSKS
jgi:phenylacetic acid degradation operon negative regulatory protein